MFSCRVLATMQIKSFFSLTSWVWNLDLLLSIKALNKVWTLSSTRNLKEIETNLFAFAQVFQEFFFLFLAIHSYLCKIFRV